MTDNYEQYTRSLRLANDNPAPRGAYWGITRHGEVLVAGTYTEMWVLLVTTFGPLTLNDIVGAGFKLGRVK